MKLGTVRATRLVLATAMCGWIAVSLASTTSAEAPAAAVPSAQPSIDPKATIERYCVTCHNSRVRAAGLTLEDRDYGQIPRDAETWEKVLVKLRTGAMPPAGVPRPDRETYDHVIALLESTIDAAAGAVPDPGRTLLHRMNRTEYQNAIRDLLTMDVDVAPLLPPDDSSYGFDNIADILGLSPALQERYLSAADKISALAVGAPEVAIPIDTTYQVPADRTQRHHIEGLPLGTRGGILITHTAPVDGDYLIKPRLWKTNNSIIRGLTQYERLEITVDGRRVHLATIGGTEPYLEGAETINGEIHQRLEVRVRLAAGPRAIGVAFVHRTSAQPPDLLQPFESALDPVDAGGVPQLDAVTVSGPLDASGSGDTPSRTRIFTCRPAQPSQERSCAESILSRLGRQAFRRPLRDDDIGALLAAFRIGRAGGDFEAGVRVALQRMLADPEFVFRIERDPSRARPGLVHRVSDLELASRLSFFLWSSIPDEELLAAASRRQLRDGGALEKHVRRMMADPRSRAIIDNFAGQWLYLRNLRSQNPDRIEFPDFDDNLRQAFRRETELLFESVMREDRNVLDLMTADYTFVNERLAKHYGIPNVYGSHFRRVPVGDARRKGLLGKGSMLLVTSRAERTSPVLRGKWILENLLGTAPPPPPADVPPFPESAGEEPATVRQRLERHRANAACASCHKLMDPVGLALENFDAVGAWRDREGGTPIDASGQLFDGTHVDGPVALRNALLSRPENFVRTLSEKLMTYALGRGLTYRDMPAIRRIVRESAMQDYRFSSIVLGIVSSAPFQMRSVPPAVVGRSARAAPVR